MRGRKRRLWCDAVVMGGWGKGMIIIYMWDCQDFFDVITRVDAGQVAD